MWLKLRVSGETHVLVALAHVLRSLGSKFAPSRVSDLSQLYITMREQLFHVKTLSLCLTSQSITLEDSNGPGEPQNRRHIISS